MLALCSAHGARASRWLRCSRFSALTVLAVLAPHGACGARASRCLRCSRFSALTVLAVLALYSAHGAPSALCWGGWGKKAHRAQRILFVGQAAQAPALAVQLKPPGYTCGFGSRRKAFLRRAPCKDGYKVRVAHIRVKHSRGQFWAYHRIARFEPAPPPPARLLNPLKEKVTPFFFFTLIAIHT